MAKLSAALRGMVVLVALGGGTAAAELLDPGPYGGAVMDRASATVWLMHSADPLLAKYDTDRDGVIGPAEAAKIAADSAKTKAERVAAVEPDALFYTGRSKTEIRATLPKPPGGGASGGGAAGSGAGGTAAGAATAGGGAPADPCAPAQSLFVRRDRLDTFEYRDGQFALAPIDRKKAKGASVAYTNDDQNDVEKLELHGRVAYVVAQQDPFSKCFTFGSDDPYDIPDVNRPFLFGYTIAPWVDAQGTLTEPLQKTERSSLQVGLDAQASIGGGPLFDLQYVVLSPYGQTDFRGDAAAYGLTAGWEPIALDAHLGGSKDLTNPFLSWFWQLRLEADWKEVDEVGRTGLKEGGYGWVGGVARLNLNFFPDRSAIMPFETAVPKWLVDRFDANLTYRYYYDVMSGDVAQMFGAAVAYNLTTDGSAALSFEYAKGRAKETLLDQDQFLISINYKY